MTPADRRFAADVFRRVRIHGCLILAVALAFVPAGPGVTQLPAPCPAHATQPPILRPSHATHVTIPPKPDVTQLPAPRPSPHVPFVGTRPHPHVAFVGTRLSPHIAFVNTRPHPHVAFVDTGYYLHVAFVNTQPHPHVVCVCAQPLSGDRPTHTPGLDTGLVLGVTRHHPFFVCLRKFDNPTQRIAAGSPTPTSLSAPPLT
ncbi:hypothetical protein DFH07DRAFT_957890 [Mycena maculata]|uniref:Uncharacterized protein n=1 Tax=Mycena maculata TaxID=230809 RepID=A0AAD7J926_9AGAR|nr:hypothetical protein DFH07DRAFT_957890 [Mycena maculata]